MNCSRLQRVCRVYRPPIVLPYYHSGMGAVMPYRARIPRLNHSVTVTFGDPVDLDDVACNCNKAGHNQRAVWKEITARVHSTLSDLETRSVANVDQTKDGWAPARHMVGHGGRLLYKPDGTPVPVEEAQDPASDESVSRGCGFCQAMKICNTKTIMIVARD